LCVVIGDVVGLLFFGTMYCLYRDQSLRLLQCGYVVPCVLVLCWWPLLYSVHCRSWYNVEWDFWSWWLDVVAKTFPSECICGALPFDPCVV
jgi:hypothetical protein